MKVVSTFHPPSSVLHSLKCNLTSNSDVEFLVVAKLDRLDVYLVHQEGLRFNCTLEIWGRIKAVRAIPVDESGKSNLLVMTDHPYPELIFLSYSASRNDTRDAAELRTLHYITLHERSARTAEFFNDVLLDPSGSVAVISCYAGKLKVVLISGGNYQRDFDISIRELNLLALTFIVSNSDELSLSILHIDHQQRMQLLARDLVISEDQLSPKPSAIFSPTPLPAKSFSFVDSAPQLISVPSLSDHLGGILVLGGKKILYYELTAQEAQAKAKGKSSRTDKKKKSYEQAEATRAKEKEVEREWRKKKAKSWVEWPWSEVKASCKVGEDGTKYLIGDAFGRLAMLSVSPSEERRLTLLAIGETSPATTLTYLTSQVLYLGSHLGDPQLLRINTSPVSALESPTLPVPSDIKTISPSDLTLMSSASSSKEKWRSGEARTVTPGKEEKGIVVLGQGNYLSVVDSWKNIAPIMDAVLVDLDGSGQQQIVTCSGGRSMGSLNVVRNGADFQALAVAEGLENVTNIWPIRALFEDTKDTHILLSTVQESHLFRFEGSNRLKRISSSSTGFITTEPTFALGNVPRRLHKKVAPGHNATSVYIDSSLVVQVTKQGAKLVEYDMALGQYTEVGEGWTPGMVQGGNGWDGREVVAAGVNASQFALALNGARLVLLNLSEKNGFTRVAYRDVGDAFAGEISAISCTPLNPSKNFTNHIAVSFWGSNQVKLFSPKDGGLSVIYQSPALRALPRSLLFYNFGKDTSSKALDYHPHLVVGLADGTVVSYSWRNNELFDPKTISLGDTPVFLNTCQVDGRKALFACGSRASILFWDKETLRHSPVILKDIAAASCLNTSSFSSCLVLATSNGLIIGDVKDLDKMHIRNIPLGLDNPRRIVHHPELKMFGVACLRENPLRLGEPESITSSFKILEDGSCSQLGQYNCGQEEEITAIHTLSVPHRNCSLPCFVVGSCRYESGETEPKYGQLMVFRIHHEGFSPPKLILAASAQVDGCIFALTNIDGMIAAAVNGSVMIFRIAVTNDVSSYSLALHKVAEWNRSHYATSLVSGGNTLMVGDAISSVSFLKLVQGRLETVARDYGSLWPACLEALDDKSVIGVNSDHNLFSFTLQETELQTTLENDGGYYLNDTVNKFISGALTTPDTSSHSTLEPRQLFFTSSGRIGVILHISQDISIHMTELQRNMAQVVHGHGGLSHSKFRALKSRKDRSDTEASSFGFLDGDFLERFLTLPSNIADEIMQGKNRAERLTMSKENIQQFLERLQRLH